MKRDVQGLTRRDALIAGAGLSMAGMLPGLVRSAAAAEAVDIAAAKKEGNVVLYTSAPIKAAQQVANAFEKKYGIKVELFRSGGTEVLRRFMMEQSARQVGADVLVSSDPAAIMDLADKGAFVAFKPDGFDKVPAAFNDAEGRYVAQRVSLIALYGRTDLVPEAKLPRSWDDLLDARFKDKLVMTNPSFTSLQLGVVAMMSKLRGWDYYEKLNRNGILVVPGNEQVVNMIKQGERLIAAGADSQYANEARLAGHPIKTLFPSEGTFGIPAVTAVVKGGKNPNAAKLMAEYTLSLEAQKLWPPNGIYAARTDVEPPAGSPAIGEVKVIPMDYGYISSVSAAVKKKFNEIFS